MTVYGEIATTWHTDGDRQWITIDRADPRLKVSGTLIEEAETGGMIGVTFAELDPQPGLDSRIGGILRIEAENRTVIYRITGQVPDLYAYYAEWPD